MRCDQKAYKNIKCSLILAYSLFQYQLSKSHSANRSKVCITSS